MVGGYVLGLLALPVSRGLVVVYLHYGWVHVTERTGFLIIISISCTVSLKAVSDGASAHSVILPRRRGFFQVGCPRSTRKQLFPSGTAGPLTYFTSKSDLSRIEDSSVRVLSVNTASIRNVSSASGAISELSCSGIADCISLGCRRH